MANTTNKAEEQFIEELLAPIQNFLLFVTALSLPSQNHPNPSIHPSQLITGLIKSGKVNLYDLIIQLLPENTPPELHTMIKNATDNIDEMSNLILITALILIMANVTGSVVVAADSYLSHSGKKSDKLQDLIGKLQLNTKILNPEEKQEDTIFERYKLLFKKFGRRPTDEELAVPTEKADMKLNEKKKNSLIIKIGRIRREYTFIYKQMKWLSKLHSNKKIKDNALKEAAGKEIKRLSKLYNKSMNDRENKSAHTDEVPLDENLYYGRQKNVFENDGNSYITPTKKHK